MIYQSTLAFSIDHDMLQETIGVVLVPIPNRPRLSLPQLQRLLKCVPHNIFIQDNEFFSGTTFIHQNGPSPLCTWTISPKIGNLHCHNTSATFDKFLVALGKFCALS